MTQLNGLSYEDVQEQLENGLKSIFESGRFQDLLKVMASQKNYSFNNSLMIAFQRPEATMVMGYKEWLKFGRFVEKGEKGIKILAPIIKKESVDIIDTKTNKPMVDSSGNKVQDTRPVIRGFKTATVFDVAQTTGKEIPNVRDFVSRNLKNDENMAKLYQDFKGFITEKGYPVSEQQTENGVGGYFARFTNEIVISTNTNKNDTEKFRVLIHEYAHALLHGQDKEFVDAERGHKEAQAESTAYIVSSYYGLDIGDISHGYIATWAQNAKLAMKAVEQIRSTANTIIDELQLLQKDKINDFYNGNENEKNKAKKMLMAAYNLEETDLNPNAPETEFTAINRKNGIVMNLTLITDEKGNSFFRTNRNLIESLDQVLENGNITILHAKKVMGVEQNQKRYINDDYSIKKIRNGGYVVQANEDKQILSVQFETKDEAKLFQRRAAMGQALLELSEAKKEWNKDQNNNEKTVNYNTAKDEVARTTAAYFELFDKQKIEITSQQENIAWALMKNPQIKTVKDLEEFVTKHQHLPNYKNINLEHDINKNVKEQKRELEASR